MKNTLFSGLMIGALVVSIGAIGLLNTPSADADPNCDKAGVKENQAGNVRGNMRCIDDQQPLPECQAALSNPHHESCRERGN